MHILIMSDVLFPHQPAKDKSDAHLCHWVDEYILNRMAKSDVNIVNLECVLTESSEEADKWGVHLYSSPEYASVIGDIPNVIVNLANNHALDYGHQGLIDTQTVLRQNGAEIVGTTSAESYISPDRKIAIFSISENGIIPCQDENDEKDEYPITISDDNCDRISELKRSAEKLLVLFHGGEEFYPYPTPRQQERLRSYIDAGADLVVCQHNHCISSEEDYHGGKIIYGQGGFVFAPRPEIQGNITSDEASKMLSHGMMIDWDTDSDTCSYDVYEIRDGHCVSCPGEDELLKEYKSRSEQINSIDFVKELWKQYALTHSDALMYLEPSFIPRSRRNLYTVVKRQIHLAVNRIAGRDNVDAKRVRQMLECENSAELVETLQSMRSVL